jgi:hypothetical protein
MEDQDESPAETTDAREGRHPGHHDLSALLRRTGRNGFFFLLGVAGLLLVFSYRGPCFNLVHSYGGNLTASFAFYFQVRSIGVLRSPPAVARLTSSPVASGLIALLVAELFEATDGFFGVMTNVYDPLDYGANALGVAVAVAVDVLAAYVANARKPRIEDTITDHPPDRNAA